MTCGKELLIYERLILKHNLTLFGAGMKTTFLYLH